MNIKTIFHCAGSYTVTDGNREISVTRVELWDGESWVAADKDDRYRYSDPLPTKREAVEAAVQMLSRQL